MNTTNMPCNKLQALREAMREEMDATNTYEQLKELIPEYAKVFDEIKEDEINHSGRLLDLIMKLDPAEVSSFNKGLGQSE